MIAASFFDRVHVVGPVGDDFGDHELEILATRGTELADVERITDGRTFFWAGEYGWDLNSRETLDTQLNVTADWKPKLSAAARAAEVLFLANIQLELQREVLEGSRASFVALDSVNLWIEVARDALVDVISRVNCVILNDAELRQLTKLPNLLAAAREVLDWGPSMVVAKQGEYGSALVTKRVVLHVAGIPARNRGRSDRRSGSSASEGPEPAPRCATGPRRDHQKNDRSEPQRRHQQPARVGPGCEVRGVGEASQATTRERTPCR